MEESPASLAKLFDRVGFPSEELEDLHLHRDGKVVGRQELIRWHWESSQSFTFQAKGKGLLVGEGRILSSKPRFPGLKRSSSNFTRAMNPRIIPSLELGRNRGGSQDLSATHRSSSKLNATRLQVQVRTLFHALPPI